MPRYQFRVTLGLKGPVLTKSSGPGGYGLDSPFARDSQDRFYIPGTLVKGRMRHAFAELREAVEYEPNADMLMPKAENWFGPPNERGDGNRKNPDGSFERHNTRIFFSDFVLDGACESQWRRRIANDDNRHAADEQMMQVLESPIAAGKTADFIGTITFDADTETRDFVRYRIVKALRWAGCFGANTSVGFGRLSDLRVDLVEAAAPVPTETEAIQDGPIWLCLTADSPLCITETRGAENLFESGVEIGGGVLKGALSSQWKREGKSLPELEAHFDQIRVTHAKPMANAGTEMPVALPLSLAEVSGSYRDFALSSAPPTDLSEEVRFSPDWKGDPAPLFGWPKVERELRVRTAIDRSRGRALDKNLFAYEMVRPESLKWCCSIDLRGVSDERRTAVRSQLLELIADGIHAVGKTKASLKVEVLRQEPSPKHRSNLTPVNGKFIVTLQTPAILVDPAPLTESRDPELLLEAYREVFWELSNGSLRLEHFFALHKLRGGLYLYKRFQEGRGLGREPAPYEPYLLTQPGSVFVLAIEPGRDTEARKCIEQWHRSGLDVPAWAIERFRRRDLDGAHWSNNPYIPQNGFGEIAVNLGLHFSGEVLHA